MEDKVTTQKLADFFNLKLKERIPKKVPKRDPHRILIKSTNEWYATEKGKTIWNQKSHAKLALLGDLKEVFNYKVCLALGGIHFKEVDEFIEYFINNEVEYVPYKTLTGL